MKNDYPSDLEIMDFLQFLKTEESKKTIESYSVIKDMISNYSIPCPIITVPKGTLLYRSRVHFKNESFFHSINDISHQPDKTKILHFGRANEPLQSIFYCSDNSFVAFFETSKIARDNSDVSQEIITTGVWEVQEDFRISNILSNSSIAGHNKTVDDLHGKFEAILSKSKCKETTLLRKYLDFVSIEFTKDALGDEANYYISCAFSNYIYSYLGSNEQMQVHGILYPSVTHREEGMNLALMPDIIETKKIMLKRAFREVLAKTSHDKYEINEIIRAKSIDQTSCKIIWE